jgi:uncharacterized protein YggE
MWNNNKRRKTAMAGGALMLALGLLTLGVAGCSSGSNQTGAQGNLGTPLAGSSDTQSPYLNTITVSGNGTVSTLPDEAVIQVAVESSADTATAALDQNSQQTQKVLDRLRADGVPDSAVETTNVAVYPDRSYDPKTGQETTTGYRATNSVTVTLKDFKVIGQVFAAATEAGANNISGPFWQLSENSQAMIEALTEAAANARNKADALAAAQGLAVGDVLILNETSTSSVYPPLYYDQSKAVGAETPSVTSPPVSPQSLDVTASVSVTYQLKR